METRAKIALFPITWPRHGHGQAMRVRWCGGGSSLRLLRHRERRDPRLVRAARARRLRVPRRAAGVQGARARRPSCACRRFSHAVVRRHGTVLVFCPAGLARRRGRPPGAWHVRGREQQDLAERPAPARARGPPPQRRRPARLLLAADDVRFRRGPTRARSRASRWSSSRTSPRCRGCSITSRQWRTSTTAKARRSAV